MKKIFYIFAIFLLSLEVSEAQDTFSITAVDLATNQVGSAGASCIAGAIILSDVHPGVGIIHTQASYLSGNQNYARSLMNMGLSPQAIIDSLILHDAGNNPTIRQYGIVDLIAGGRRAGYTGVNCQNWKGHILGPTYTIQGNILLGPQILDSMQARFLNTPGTLATKLMAALQGAKVVGADTRCISRNTSSISAFLRVARPTDPVNNLWLDLNVNNTPVGRDPIDSLQILYNLWLLTGITPVSNEVPENPFLYQNYPNPFNPVTVIKFAVVSEQRVRIAVYDVLGKEVVILTDANLRPGTYEARWDASAYPSGIYYYKLTEGDYTDSKKMILIK
jgi:uncharacterized Ntn-hydrolase superfamily protein